MRKDEIDSTAFKHRIPIQVRYKDVDMQKHVNNASILSYVEQGRVEYFNMLFPDNDFDTNGLIIARTEIDYFQPIFLNEEIFCYTRIASIGNKSFVFENVIADKQDSIKCYVKSIMVCFNYKNNTSIPVPEHWKNKIIDFEKLNSTCLTPRVHNDNTQE